MDGPRLMLASNILQSGGGSDPAWGLCVVRAEGVDAPRVVHVQQADKLIVGEFGGINHLSWVVTSYLLASTISTPLVPTT